MKALILYDCVNALMLRQIVGECVDDLWECV